jgi:hypothetical protein
VQVDLSIEVVAWHARWVDRHPTPDCLADTIEDVIRGQSFILDR